MTLLTVGLSHNTAPLAIRERLVIPPERFRETLDRLVHEPDVSEGAILSTCNRTEVVTVAEADNDEAIRHWLCRQRDLDPRELAPHFYVYRDRASVRHTLRVAAGLDSMVLGEPQILGQMKDAFRQARDARAAGPMLTRLFEHSFAVAKEVRSATDIGTNPVSMAYAGVRLAQRIFSDFEETSAMLIGAGDTVELTARHLAQAGLRRMVFANRSLDRAQALATRFHGYAIALSEVPAHLVEADMLLTSTAAPDWIVGLPDVRAALKRRRRRPMFMLDLAVPRDVEPAVGELEDVYLYTVDDLQGVVRENLRSRQQAALLADSMIDDRIDEFLAWLESRKAVDTITALRGQAEEQRDAVLRKAHRMLRAGKDPEEVIDYVGHNLTNKLLHYPSRALRNAMGRRQRDLLRGARELFGIDDED